MYNSVGNDLLESVASTQGITKIAELTLTATPADNGAIYKCTAQNAAISEPLMKPIRFTVYCKSHTGTVLICILSHHMNLKADLGG